MKKILVLLILIFFTYSCKMFIFGTETFVLNRYNNNEEIVYGVVMSGFGTTEVINGNSIIIKDTATTAIAIPEKTQLLWDFGVDFSNTPVFDIYLRSSATDYYTNKNNINIRFDSENSSISFFENEKLVKNQKYNFNKELRRIKIDDFENKIKVSIDCDDVFYHTTSLANTEYLIFKNNKLDTLNVSAISTLVHLDRVL